MYANENTALLSKLSSELPLSHLTKLLMIKTKEQVKSVSETMS